MRTIEMMFKWKKKCSIQCIWTIHSMHKCKQNSFTCKQCAQISKYIDQKKKILHSFAIHSLCGMSVVVLLTVFMLSLDSLIRFRKIFCKCWIVVFFCGSLFNGVYLFASIDAYKMILFWAQWAFNSTVRLKFNIRLLSLFFSFPTTTTTTKLKNLFVKSTFRIERHLMKERKKIKIHQ